MPRSKVKFGSLQEFLAHFGNSFDPVFNDEIIRFKQPHHKSKSGWYIGRSYNDILMIIASDYRDGEDWHLWCSKSKTTKEDKIEIEKFQKHSIEKNKLIQEEMHLSFKIENQEYLMALAGENLLKHPYFIKKKIDKNYCAESIFYENKKIIAIPMMDEDGDVWNFQRIFEDGQKYFNKGRSKGLFNYIDGNKETVFVCEGFATAVSVHKATGAMVYIAFSVNNLSDVTSVAKSRHKKVIICADNDSYSEKNPGIDGAKKAAKKNKCLFVAPEFKNKSSKPTDFNDLEMLYGLDEIKSQLTKNNPTTGDIVRSEVEADPEYLQYKSFFDMRLPNVRVCPMNKVAYIYDENSDQRKPAENLLKVIQSYASGDGLKASEVDMHLQRWINEKEPQYLMSMDEWDGEERLDKFLSHLKPSRIPRKHFVEIMKEWCSNIFRRLDDKHYRNFCPIFVGGQDIGKDTFIRHLFSGLKSYFANISMSDYEEKNFQNIIGKIVVNISEFDKTAKAHPAILKNVITSPQQTMRLPYERRAQDINFYCSFIGSSNTEDVLFDTTGSSRFAVIEIDSIDFGYDKSNPTQLLAEIRMLADSGFEASDKAWSEMNEIMDVLTPDDEFGIAEAIKNDWSTRVRDFIIYQKDLQTGWRHPWLSQSLAFPIILELSKKYQCTEKKIRNILKKAGFQRLEMVGTGRVRVWHPSGEISIFAKDTQSTCIRTDLVNHATS